MASRHGVHRTPFLGWHPRSLVLLAWIQAEVKRRGGGRGVLADVLEEGMEAAMLAQQWTCPCPCSCWAPGQFDDSGERGWCDGCRMNIHSSDRPQAVPEPDAGRVAFCEQAGNETSKGKDVP